MKNYCIILSFLLLFGCSGDFVNDQPCGSAGEADFSVSLSAFSKDNIEIPFHLYKGVSNDFRTIILLHQANSNKMEYCSIAKRLQGLGYNVVAVDLRSGGNSNGYENISYNTAVSQGLGTSFKDAYPDVLSIVHFVQQKNGSPVYLWGSSYSAGWAMRYAKENKGKVAKVIAFSPGEYYENYSLQDAISGLDIPTFVTSSKSEANENLEELVSVVQQDKLEWFIPKKEGDHGSKALWESQPSNEEYWTAVEAFLKN